MLVLTSSSYALIRNVAENTNFVLHKEKYDGKLIHPVVESEKAAKTEFPAVQQEVNPEVVVPLQDSNVGNTKTELPVGTANIPGLEEFPAEVSLPTYFSQRNDGEGGAEKTQGEVNERKINPSKAESKIWQEFENYKGNIKTNGLSGKNREYYKWDKLHNDIEVYDSNGKHLGSKDPTTGQFYKSANPKYDIGREL